MDELFSDVEEYLRTPDFESSICEVEMERTVDAAAGVEFRLLPKANIWSVDQYRWVEVYTGLSSVYFYMLSDAKEDYNVWKEVSINKKACLHTPINGRLIAGAKNVIFMDFVAKKRIA